MAMNVFWGNVIKGLKEIAPEVVAVVARYFMEHKDDETIAVVHIKYLTVKELKRLIRERLERKNELRVAFGETRKIMDEYAKDILANVPLLTMYDLEKYCEETPYFVVDYDPSTEEVSDYTTIKTGGVDEKIAELMHDNDRIVLFE